MRIQNYFTHWNSFYMAYVSYLEITGYCTANRISWHFMKPSLSKPLIKTKGFDLLFSLIQLHPSLSTFHDKMNAWQKKKLGFWCKNKGLAVKVITLFMVSALEGVCPVPRHPYYDIRYYSFSGNLDLNLLWIKIVIDILYLWWQFQPAPDNFLIKFFKKCTILSSVLCGL